MSSQYEMGPMVINISIINCSQMGPMVGRAVTVLIEPSNAAHKASLPSFS